MSGFARGDAGGRVVVRLEESPSTNDEVRERWAADESGRRFPHLSSVTTESQTAGRGRLGREWVSPPGACLAVSTLLRLDPSAVGWLGWLQIVGGLALRDALVAELERAAGSGDLADARSAESAGARSAESAGAAESQQRAPADRVRLKWPNDVQLDGLKIAGILGEVLGANDRELACVIGTGINLRLTHEQLPVPTATSLAIAGVDPVDGMRVERAYLAGLAKRVRALERHDGDAAAAGLLDEYVRACVTIGQRVRVSLPGGGLLEGRATGVTPDGHLIVVDDAQVSHVVAAGDVERVRPAEG